MSYARPRFTVVVSRELPGGCEELARALSGEDVRVVLDRRRQGRAGPGEASTLGRRVADR